MQKGVEAEPLFSLSPLVTEIVAAALLVAVLVIFGLHRLIGEGVPASVCRMLTFAMSFVLLLRAIGDFKYVGFCKPASDSASAYWDA